MIRDVYRFHVYYHVRQVLKRLQTPLPHKTGFNATDNPYTESEFLKICEEFLMILSITRMKNFIGPINATFIGPMIILAQTQ